MIPLASTSFIPFAQLETASTASQTSVPMNSFQNVAKPISIDDVSVVLVGEISTERSLLCSILQRSTMFRCQVYEANDLEAATELSRRCRPDVILLDSIIPYGHVRQEAVMSMRHLQRFHAEQAFIILAQESGHEHAASATLSC